MNKNDQIYQIDDWLAEGKLKTSMSLSPFANQDSYCYTEIVEDSEALSNFNYGNSIYMRSSLAPSSSNGKNSYSSSNSLVGGLLTRTSSVDSFDCNYAYHHHPSAPSASNLSAHSQSYNTQGYDSYRTKMVASPVASLSTLVNTNNGTGAQLNIGSGNSNGNYANSLVGLFNSSSNGGGGGSSGELFQTYPTTSQQTNQQQQQPLTGFAAQNIQSKCRQLPCRTFISTGSCPYGDRCVFLHDPSIVSKPVYIRSKVTINLVIINRN